VALVTGGSSGIGAATSRALAQAGARLLIAGRDAGRLAELAAETGGTPLRADLAAPGGPAGLARAALDAAGRVDLLVSNAGIGWAGPVGELPQQTAQDLVTVNLTAPIQLCALLVPGMTERGSGRVVFVSSIAGATGVRGEAAYSAAKGGLGYFAESLAYELAGTGVGISLVVPGVVDTPFFERRGRPYDRRRPVPVSAEKVAAAIVGAARQDRAVVFVPGWMRFPAWLHGAAPGMFRALAGRFG